MVTGGTRGIGRGIAHELARAGSRVAITGRDLSSARAVAEEVNTQGGDAIGLAVDVTQDSSVRDCVSEAVRIFSGVDILINNAGVFQRRLGLDLSSDDFNACLDVNLTGMWRMTQALVPYFRRQGGGRVVNVASTGARRGVDFAPAYCASKAGVISLTQSLASALGPYNINVNAVCPGAIETALREEIRQLGANLATLAGGGAAYALSNTLSVVDVGHAVVFLASDYSRSITGQALNVDRGFMMS